MSNSFSGSTPQSGVSQYYGGDIPFIRSGEIHEDSTELNITEYGSDDSGDGEEDGVSAPKRKRHTGRPMKNSMPITSNARTLLKSAGPRIGLHVGQYLIASGASALTSIPKATMRKNGNCSRLFCGNDALRISRSDSVLW